MRFRVYVRKSWFWRKAFVVDAVDVEEAEQKALAMAKDYNFPNGKIEYEVDLTEKEENFPDEGKAI